MKLIDIGPWPIGKTNLLRLEQATIVFNSLGIEVGRNIEFQNQTNYRKKIG